jgi:ABC-type transporter Mla subunit MlaD
MTTERWTDEMLDRLVGSINTLADVSERNTENINRLSSIAEIHQQNFDAVIGEIQEIQNEVRGLQTENRRILDQLINRNDENG